MEGSCVRIAPMDGIASFMVLSGVEVVRVTIASKFKGGKRRVAEASRRKAAVEILSKWRGNGHSPGLSWTPKKKKGGGNIQ